MDYSLSKIINIMKIKIWADYACPYSYIGEKQLMDIIKKEGLSDKVEIRFQTYQLIPMHR